MERRIKSGRDCIRRALKLYVDVDGADIRGAFRDAITDVFHLMDEANSKGLVVLPNALYADHMDCASEAWKIYEEEKEQAENEKVARIPKRKLVLHIRDPLEFGSSRTLLESRLKGVTDETHDRKGTDPRKDACGNAHARPAAAQPRRGSASCA